MRIDRETRDGLSPQLTRRLLASLKARLRETAAVIVCDYGKGVVTQPLLNEINCYAATGALVELCPKPVHQLNLSGLSLITQPQKSV